MNLNNSSTKLNQHKAIIITTCLLVTFLVVVNVLLAAQLSHLGIYLQQINRQEQAIVSQNQSLSQQINQQGSLHDLLDKASTMGFVKNSNYHYFDQKLPIALESN